MTGPYSSLLLSVLLDQSHISCANIEVMKLLGKSLPHCTLLRSVVFLGMQTIRLIMQRLKIGLYIESLLVRITGREVR